MPIDLHHELLSRAAVLVGSRAWGGAADNSDWDYCLLKDHEEAITKLLTENGYAMNRSPYLENSSAYVPFGDTNINIIYLSKNILKAWAEASEMMHKFPKDKISNRKLRRYTFTLLVDTFYHWS